MSTPEKPPFDFWKNSNSDPAWVASEAKYTGKDGLKNSMPIIKGIVGVLGTIVTGGALGVYMLGAEATTTGVLVGSTALATKANSTVNDVRTAVTGKEPPAQGLR